MASSAYHTTTAAAREPTPATVIVSVMASESAFNTVSPSGSDAHWRVPASVTPVLILSASQNSRAAGGIYNHGSGTLYLKFGGSAGISTSGSSGVYDLQMAPGSYYELPKPPWQGQMWGAWDIAGGSARVFELGDND